MDPLISSLPARRVLIKQQANAPRLSIPMHQGHVPTNLLHDYDPPFSTSGIQAVAKTKGNMTLQ